MGGQSSKQLLGDNNHNNSKKQECHVEELYIINPHNDFEIPCKLWTPTTNNDNGGRRRRRTPRAVVLFLHGGMFSQGSRDSHQALTQALVQDLGVIVLTASFRDGSTTTYASGTSLDDVSCLADWLANHYPKLPLGIVGSSSGGWFAMALCNQLEYGSVQFCILLCPVAHPHARAVYLKHCCEGTTPLENGKELYPVRHEATKAQYILKNQLQFFESYKQMAIAADSVSQNLHHVPTLLVLAAHDANVPPTVTQTAIQQWASKTLIVARAGHEIQNVPPTGYSSYLPDMDCFLQHVLEEEENGGWANGHRRRPWCS